MACSNLSRYGSIGIGFLGIRHFLCRLNGQYMITDGLRQVHHHDGRHTVAEALPLLGVAAHEDEIIREGTVTALTGGAFCPINPTRRVGQTVAVGRARYWVWPSCCA